jgi:hypothetical protein
MTIRTLAEAAAEILKASKSGAPQEPLKKLEGEVEDLGGSTTEKPEGDAIGANASKNAKRATPPGKPSPVGQEPYKGPIKEEEESEDFEEVVAEVEEDEELEENDEVGEEDLQETQENKTQMIRDIMKSVGVQEDIDALFNGEELSEDFRAKAATIFESAVISRAEMVVEKLEEEILQAAMETVEEIKEELENNIDSYLNYVVEEWKEDNQVAIESGLKSELTEEFIRGLRNLFVEHYIEIPEDKVDVIDELAQEIESLRENLNDALNVNIEMKRKIDEAKKAETILSVCESLTATQVEKMKTLAEGVDFTAVGEFREKLEILKENYFSNKVQDQQSKNLFESAEPVHYEEEVVPQHMQQYVNAISRTLVK